MAPYQQYQCIISMVLVPRLVKNKQWPRMRLLLKSTGPCTPGGRKLQPVPYPIHWSHIAINIEQSLIPLESQVLNVIEYHFFHRTFFYRMKIPNVIEHIFFLSHESIKNIESNVLFYRTYFSYRMKLLKISNQMFCFIEHIFFYRMKLLKISNQIFFIEHNFYRILLPFGRHR